MIRFTIITLIVVLFIISGYLFLSSRHSIKVEIEKLKREYLPSEQLEIKINLKNTGYKPNYFFVELKSDLGTFIPQTVFLKPNTERKLKFLFNISPKTNAGIYSVVTNVKSRQIVPFVKKPKLVNLFSKEIFVTVKSPPPPPPPKPVIKPLTGKVEFVAVPEKFIYNTTSYIKLKIKNTSDRTADFLLSLNIKNLQYTTTKSFSFTDQLEKQTTKEHSIEYFIDSESCPEGEYSLTAELRNRKTNKLLSSDSAITSLTDTYPEISLSTITIPSKKEIKKKPIRFVYILKDDVEIKSANLIFTDLKTNFTTSYKLILISGNKQFGEYSTSFILPKKTKEFSYFVSAIDKKGQESISNKHTRISIK